MAFISLLTLFSCTEERKETNLISPKENYRLLTKSSDFLVDKTETPDSLSSLEAFIQLENESVVATKDGIYFLDAENQKLKKYYRLTTEYVSTVNFSTNSNESKLLVNVSSGQSTITLLFQIHLATLEVDWLATHKGRFTATSYSNTTNTIALGTTYKKITEEKVFVRKPKPMIYYATLFTVNAKTGTFLTYFEQGESVAQLLFSENGESIYSVLDWPHVDTFLWNVSDTKTKAGIFGRDNTGFYNAFELDERYFLTISDNGLYKWDRKNPEAYKIVYKGNMNSEDDIIQVDENYIIVSHANGLVNPPTVKYFDKNLAITDAVMLDIPFRQIHFYNGKFSGISSKDEIGFYNVDTKKIEEIITKDALQQQIMRN